MLRRNPGPLVIDGAAVTALSDGQRESDARLRALRDYNENHDPANGEFSSGEGGGGASKPDEHLAELNAAPKTTEGQPKFEKALTNLENNKSISKEQLKGITAKYTNNVVLAKTKPEMIKEIRKHFVRSGRFANKIS